MPISAVSQNSYRFHIYFPGLAAPHLPPIPLPDFFHYSPLSILFSFFFFGLPPPPPTPLHPHCFSSFLRFIDPMTVCSMLTNRQAPRLPTVTLLTEDAYDDTIDRRVKLDAAHPTFSLHNRSDIREKRRSHSAAERLLWDVETQSYCHP